MSIIVLYGEPKQRYVREYSSTKVARKSVYKWCMKYEYAVARFYKGKDGMIVGPEFGQMIYNPPQIHPTWFLVDGNFAEELGMVLPDGSLLTGERYTEWYHREGKQRMETNASQRKRVSPKANAKWIVRKRK